MSKDSSLKVYFNEDILDLKDTSTTVSNKSSRKHNKSLKSTTETSLAKSIKRDIRKSGVKSTQNCGYSNKKQNVRATSVDSRFRRIRSSSPDEDKRSVITVASHYSASVPLINQANQDKAKEEREFSQEYNFDAFGEGEGSVAMRELKHLSVACSKKDVNVEKEGEILIAPSEYCTAVYDASKTEPENLNDVTTLLNYKYEYPVSQNWGDPRLLKKYKGLFRPRQLNSHKSSWSLPVYAPIECKLEGIQPQNSDLKDDVNTYTYEDEESDGDLKKSKLALIYEPGLPWPLYFAACCCGATLVAAAAWYCLENEILAKYFKRFFIKKEDESEKNAFTKIAKNVLSNIVYVLNRIIKTTAHILVSPRSEVFAQPPKQTPWWKFY